MTGKTYSAGTIFLQVVPVFDQAMHSITREAKSASAALGDEMERGGRQAGSRAGKALGEELNKEAEKAGKQSGDSYAGAFGERLKNAVRSAEREMNRIDFKTASEKSIQNLEKVKAKLAELKDVKIDASFDAKKVLKDIAEVQATIDALTAADHEIDVDFNMSKASRDLAKLRTMVQEFRDSKIKIEPEIELKQVERALGAYESKMRKGAKAAADAFGEPLHRELREIKAELAALGDVDLDLDMSTEEFDRKFLQVESKLAGFIAENPGVDLDVRNAKAALAQIETVQAAANHLDQTYVVDIDVRGAASAGILAAMMGKLRGSTDGAGLSSRDAANSFRAFNAIILGVALILPGIIPLIGALGGALLALGPIMAGVGAGAGVMVLGFSGIGTALKALSADAKAQGKQTQTAAKQIESAARGVADAERNLARAREDAAQRSADAARSVARAKQDAARQEQDAARAVADAERASAQAIQTALRQRADAERNLAKAQRDAKAAQDNLVKAREAAKKELEDNSNAIAQNKLDERQGVIDLFNATVADTAARQDGGTTNLEKEQASINLAEAQLRLKMIREQGKALAEKDKAGIAGTNAVQSAQDALTTALERQKTATENLGEADRRVNEAREEGARRVADAVRQQARVHADAARSIADAQRNAARTAQDNATAIADAQRGLTRAQEDYQTALHNTADEATTTGLAVQDAMKKLSPAGRDFVRYLWSLRQGFYDVRTAAQEGMLPGVMDAFKSIIGTYGQSFPKFVGSMARTIGQLFREFGKMMTNPLWQDFFGMLNELGPKFMRQFGRGMMNWMSVFAKLLTVAAPWAEKLSTAMLGISKHALAFVDSKKGTKVITDFLAYAQKVGPDVWAFIKNIWGAAVNLGKALAPLGGLVLKAFDSILKFIADMDPKVLGAIVTAIIALVIAFQVVVGLTALIAAGTAAIEAGLVALAAGAIILVIGAIVILYTQSETARKIINAAIGAIGDVIKWLWEHITKPYLTGMVALFKALWTAVQWAWDHVFAPVFKALGAVIGWLWSKVVKPVVGFIVDAFTAFWKLISWAWKNVWFPIIDLLGKAVWKLWSAYFKVAVGLIMRIWHDVAETFGDVWDIIGPLITKLATAIGSDLVDTFRDAVRIIGNLWSGLVDILGEPVEAVIKFTNKYLIGGFNKIADFVGSKHMGEIPIPSWTQDKPKKAAANPGGKSAQSKNTGGKMNAHVATGGVLPGYTPGRDVHHFASPTGGQLHLSGGEAVMRPEWTAAVGPDQIAYWNKIAREQGVAGLRAVFGMGNGRGSRAFAKGGVFWPVPGHQTGTYPGHDGVDINRGSGWDDYGDPIRAFRSGQIVYVGAGRGYGNAIFEQPDQGPLVVYGHTSAQMVHAGQRVLGGQLIGRVGNTGHSTAPHLHFGTPGGTTAGALALLAGATDVAGGASAGGGFHLPGFLAKILGKPVEWAKGLASKAGDALTEKFGGNPFIKTLAQIPVKLAEGLADKVENLLGGGASQAIDSVAAGPVQSVVRKMAAARGWVGAQWDALATIVQRESGWNPNAANPNSSARGLFQKMTSIHGAIEDTVGGQAAWGLNYIANRYGNPSKALAYWDAHGSYADGGIIGSTTGSSADLGGNVGSVANNGTMMYDNGGYLPPGLTTVLNLTGKPEPVYTHEQDIARRASGDGSGDSFTLIFQGTDLTADDVADKVEFTLRKHGKLGKYGKQG